MSAHTPLTTQGSPKYIADCTKVRRRVIDLSPRLERLEELRAELRKEAAKAQDAYLGERSKARRAHRVAKRRIQRKVPVTSNTKGYSFAFSTLSIGLALLIAFTPFVPVFANEIEDDVVEETVVTEIVEETEVVVEEVEIEEIIETEEAPTEEQIDEEPTSVDEVIEELIVEEEESLLEQRLEEIELEVEDLEEDQASIEEVSDDALEIQESEEVEEEVIETEVIEGDVVQEELEEVEEVTPESLTVTLRGSEEVEIIRGLGVVYNDLGAIADDGTDIEPRITTFLNEEETTKIHIDTSVEGEYTIAYRAELESGLSAEAVRKVRVASAESVREEEEKTEEIAETKEEAVEESEEEDISEDEGVTVIHIQSQEAVEEKDVNELRAEIKEELLKEVRDSITQELKENCLEFDDGSYYCINTEAKGGEESEGAEGLRVYSEQDSQGADQEIYYVKNGKTVRITNNDVEDRFPHMDVFGKRIVWQSQVDSYWQIFAYNLETDEVEQITEETTNSMNPQVYKETLVWQSWANNNWEVFTATYESDSWHVVQVTHNNWHDVFPNVAVGLVTWQSFENDTWSVLVYDLETGTTSQLSQGAQKYENPRFSLIWDARDEEGEVSVYEYDLSSGEVDNFEKQPKEKEGDIIPDAPVEQEVPLPGRSETSTSTQLVKDDEGEE